MLKGIKEYIAKQRIGKLGKDRKSKVYNYNNANLIGVVITLESETQFNLVLRYIRKLKEDHGIRKIMLLALITDKETPGYFKETEHIIGVTKKEFSYRGNSKNGRFPHFLNEKFNILLDFSREINSEVEFVVKSSKSSFKVGKFADSNEDLYDFMIQQDGSKDLSRFMDSLDRYLIMIDKKK